MWKLILEASSYLSFTCVIYTISFLNRNSGEYFQAQHLRQLFLNPNDLTHMYSQVTSINHYWKWLEESFLVNLAAEQWYNGKPDNQSYGFLSDKTNRLIGWATMRQLRIRADTCKVKSTVQTLIPHCYDEYSAANEEIRSFQPGWSTNITTQNYSSSINQAFIYQTSKQLDTYICVGQYATYRSGGYVYEFRGSLSKIRDDLSQLHHLGWIDIQTRAVIIQLNLYNPYAPLFTSVVIIIELLPTSGVFPSARFEPLEMFAFRSLIEIICVVIYFIFIITSMIREIRTFIRLKKSYFRRTWSYIEFGIIACSWAAVGLQIWRANEAARITHLFDETRGDVYLNFELLAYINDLFSFLLGFCCFFGTLRFLRLCRYNQRLNLLSSTLRRAGREIISFSFMFSLVYISFIILFYLQFSADTQECSTLLHTAQMLFEMLLLRFDTTVIVTAAPLLGPLYFSLFIYFVVFICMNMFASIIYDNFGLVRSIVYKGHADQIRILIDLLDKVRERFVKKKVHVVTINERENIVIPLEIPDPLKHLSTRLDRLSFYVNLHYGNNMISLARTTTEIIV